MCASTSDLFKISRILLQFLGEDEGSVPKFIMLFRIFNGVVLIFVAIFISVNFFYATGDIYVKTAQSLMSVIHTLLKYCFFIYFKTDIRKLLKSEFMMFWNELDKELVQRIHSSQRLIEQMQMCIIFASYAGVYLYFFRPILNEKNKFLLETWASNNIILDGILLACHYYFFCIVALVVLSYDIIYISLCVYVVLQLRILKHEMERFSGRCTAEEYIGKCVKCHQLLLLTFRQMKRIYSVMLLFHYFVTLITVCNDLYEVLLAGSIASDVILKFISVCILFAQFAFYTFPAERVASEFSDLSSSIYMSEWYNNSVGIQKQLLFMMLKCHQQLYFTGGGLIDVNVDTFGSVVRRSFSFYTILRNVLNK